MGIFLTLEFKHPLYCPYCGEKHTSIQYSGGGGGMDVFKVGDTCKSFEPNTINKRCILKNGMENYQLI